MIDNACVCFDLPCRYSWQYDAIAVSQAPLFLEHNEDAFDEEIATLLQTFDRESVRQLAGGQGQETAAVAEDRDSFSRGGSGRKSSRKGGGGCVICGNSSAKHRCSRCHSER